jgi:autotransporter-associated beta strand protein
VGGQGDITLDLDPTQQTQLTLTLSSPNSLTLIADRNIIINDNIAQTGSGNLVFQAGGSILLNAGLSLLTTSGNGAPSITLQSGAGGLSGSGNVTAQFGGAAPASINITQGGNSSYAGVLAGTNTVLVKGGAGTLTLAGASTYTGQTTIQGGVLRAQNSAAFGTGSVVINAGAAVELAGGITLANNFTSMGTGVGLGGALRNVSGANTITGSVALQFASNLFTADAGSLTFDRPGATSSSVTVTGAYNNLGLALGGAGDLVFNDSINLSYSLQGATVYGSLSKGNAGTVFLNAANQLGPILSVNGGTLAYSTVDFFGGAAQASRTIILDGGVLRSQVSHTIGTTANGTFLLGTNGGTWHVDPGFAVTFPGAMSGTGAFTKSGLGQLTLSGASTYQGVTTVAGGTLLLTGSLPSNSPLTVDTGAVMQLGVNSTIGSIAGSGGINLGSFTLTAGGNGTSTTFSGSISGSGNVIKAGTGTLTLAGANTYSGTTTVTGGTLTVNQQPPSTATCNGGSSNICPTATVSPVQVQTLLTPTISVTPGFSISSTTTATTTSTTTTTTSTTTTSTTSSTSTSGSSSSSTDSSSSSSGTSTTTAGTTATTTTTSDVQPVSTLPADGTTLISNANVAVLSSLESSFSTVDVGGSASASGVSSAGAPTSTSSTGSSSSTSGSDSSSTSSGARSSSSSSSAAATSTSSESGSTSDQGKADQGKADSGKSDSAGADKQESGQQSTAPAASQSAGASAAAPPPTVTVPAQQAAASSQQSDLQSGQQALGSLTPERAGGALVAPSVPQMQQSLSGATNQVRNGGLGPQSALPQGWGDAERWLMAAAALPVSSDAGRGALLPPTFNRAAYTPAVLHVRFSEARGGTVRPDTDAFLDITLVPMEGEVEGRRVEVSKQEFATLLKRLYTQLSRQESLNTADPASPARRLQQLLIGPMAPVLASRRITTLLIAADRGLQAVPFAALHDGQRYFGDAYAFSLTPSLALTSLAPPQPARGRLLAAGSAVFDGLAPLPLVPAELDQVGRSDTKDKALNKAFTPSTLLDQAADPRYSRVHVATHAEFLPGGPAASRLYSGTVPIPLSDFVKLRRARQGAPLDLISFSACRTALGDADSELGFAGLALQAGARSAVGTLWYVDDVATSAYFVQMYRYLEAGMPKAEALQLTRQAFSRGLVRLDGDRLVGADGQALLSGLTGSQQRRVAGGLENPYFWAGIELLGAAW